MPNRIIKESICRSETINSLKPFEEVLFYRLIVVCDDYGRFDGRPSVIKGYCFPLKDTAATDIKAALDKLVETGLVELYEVQGRPVLQLSTWSRHQQIRAKKSKYPSPDEAHSQMHADCEENSQLISSNNNEYQLISDDCNSPRNRNTRIENRNTETRTRAMGEVHRFEDFWAAYPNKQRRYLAEKAYCDILLSGAATEDDLVAAAEEYAKHVKESGDKVFLPNNFLEKCIFVDYLETRTQKGLPEEPEEEAKNEELIGDDWVDCETPWGR